MKSRRKDEAEIIGAVRLQVLPGQDAADIQRRHYRGRRAKRQRQIEYIRRHSLGAGRVKLKNLRGTKMEDIIFGGTDTRRPSGMAEVSLVIDNTDEENRLDIDYDEITITRRYFRTGESEYLINRKPVRLRDISELFMNTGVGKYGYSIIGQGRIAEIISQRSEDRRAVFEEAAGISKYKYKKNEAERKLAEVDENLIRVHDLLAQLGERLGPA